MKEISISHERPLIADKLFEKFGEFADWDNGVIICDGDKIHCKRHVPPEKIIHEVAHSKEQTKIGKDLWWGLYLSNDSFRLEQEVIAYKAEYAFVKDIVFDRNERFLYLLEISRVLASKMYGNLCTVQEAMKMLQ